MSFMLVEYRCRDCKVREDSLETRGDVPREKECECGGTRELCISAPKINTVWASAVSRGRTEAPPPGFIGTRKIYEEGQSTKAWRKERRELRRKDKVSSMTKEMGGKLYFPQRS